MFRAISALVFSGFETPQKGVPSLTETDGGNHCRCPSGFAVVCHAAVSVALMLLPTIAFAAGPYNVRGSDATPIRRGDDRVDTPATISRLIQMHANVHMFGIGRGQDWDDLRFEFAPAAQAAGIKVWVYLWPPSDCTDDKCTNYPPYGKRYDDWARAIAQLSVQYPVVTAWAIDDFANSRNGVNNLDYLTPAYLTQVRKLSQSIQPMLEFYPVVYYTFATQSFIDRYAPVIDALIMPYRDDPYRNTLWTASLQGQLNNLITRLASRNRKLILMVYAKGLSNTQVVPDVEYVRRVTSVGMQYTRAGTIAGVVQYGMPLTPGKPANGDVNFSRTGNGVLVLTVRADQNTAAGNWAGASARVQLNSGSTSCHLRVWHRDNRGAPTEKFGYHFKQIVIGGSVRWDRDIFNDDTEWHSTQMDLTPLLVDGAADLTLRLYEKAAVSNLHVRASFDDVTLTGCYVVDGNPSFETIGGWRYTRSGGPVLAGQHIYDPEYSTTVFNMVAQMYGQ